MTRIFVIVALGLLAGLLTLSIVRHNHQADIGTTTPTVQHTISDCSDSLIIRSQIICVELANTDAKRQQGLSGRDPLSVNTGMLFLFPKAARHSFWMKDMKFPLDFLWIRESRIVDITHNVPPPKPETPLNELERYMPSEEVDAMLEVHAGTVAALGIAIGDSVERK